MAKQTGVIQLEGTLDNITFLKTQDGHLAKKKTSVNAARINSDPDFANTRKTMAEFGRAGQAGKLFRKAFHSQLKQVQDNRVISRLLKKMMEVSDSDFTFGRGHGDRLIQDGNLLLLQNFNFNSQADLGAILFAPYTAGFDRPSGKAVIDMAAFTPKLLVTAPGGTTHYRIITAAAEFDFANALSIVAASETGLLPWNNIQQPADSLLNQLTPASTLPVFMIMGIMFYKVVNGVVASLNTGTAEAMCVVKVDLP